MEWPVKFITFDKGAVVLYNKTRMIDFSSMTVDFIEDRLSLIIGSTYCVPLDLLDLKNIATYVLLLAGGVVGEINASIFGVVDLNEKTIGKLLAVKDLTT